MRVDFVDVWVQKGPQHTCGFLLHAVVFSLECALLLNRNSAIFCYNFYGNFVSGGQRQQI